jgi:hypothetical protein
MSLYLSEYGYLCLGWNSLSPGRGAGVRTNCDGNVATANQMLISDRVLKIWRSNGISFAGM